MVNVSMEEGYLKYWAELANQRDRTDNQDNEEEDEEEDIMSVSGGRKLSSVHRVEHSDVDAAEDFLSKISNQFSEEHEVICL